MTIALYGGTFSPPHFGHIRAVAALMDELSPDLCLIMPAFAPHKSDSGNVSPKSRYEMAKLAFDGMENVTVSDLELKRGGKSYTYDTICELFEIYGQVCEIALLCGADMLRTLPMWYHGADILKLVSVYSVARNDAETDELSTISEQYFLEYGAMCRVLKLEPFDISSSAVRDMIKTGQDITGIIPDNVYKYILMEGLYHG